MWLRHAEQTHLRFMLRSLLPPKTLENTAAFIEQRSAVAAGLRVSDALGGRFRREEALNQSQ